MLTPSFVFDSGCLLNRCPCGGKIMFHAEKHLTFRCGKCHKKIAVKLKGYSFDKVELLDLVYGFFRLGWKKEG